MMGIKAQLGKQNHHELQGKGCIIRIKLATIVGAAGEVEVREGKVRTRGDTGPPF